MKKDNYPLSLLRRVHGVLTLGLLLVLGIGPALAATLYDTQTPNLTPLEVQTDNPAPAAQTPQPTQPVEPPKALETLPSPEHAAAEAFLAGSPMEGLGSLIVDTADRYGVSWRIILGIADAESSLGRHYVHPYDANCHNAWGIKPPGGRRADGSYLRCYFEWENGVESIAALLARRYKNQTPEEMCGVYVVPCNPDWLRTIKRYE